MPSNYGIRVSSESVGLANYTKRLILYSGPIAVWIQDLPRQWPSFGWRHVRFTLRGGVGTRETPRWLEGFDFLLSSFAFGQHDIHARIGHG